MDRLLIALALVAVAVVVAVVLQRRRPAPPVTTDWHIPVQLDRSDFARPSAPWLVAVFTSSTCDTCAEVWAKAQHLDTGPDGPVVAQEIEAQAEPDLHRRYAIDAVPLVLLVDDRGVVGRHFLGPVVTADLWAALAELRAGSASAAESPDEH
ncbi:MAG: hypothetical protein ACKOIA_08170 [Acidimicrobiia bacterium]